MSIRFSEAEARRVRDALVSAGEAATAEDAAARAIAAGRDPEEACTRWHARLLDAVSAPDVPRPRGPSRVERLPVELLDATAANGRGEPVAEVNRAVDEVVTSRVGFATLRRAYGVLSDPDRELLVARLAGGARQRRPDLEEPAALRAAEHVALRTQKLLRLLVSSGGSTRRALRAELGAIEPGADPAAPVRIDATPHAMRTVEVRGRVPRVRLRYVDINPDAQDGVILLVHGHGSLLEEYADLAPRLAERFRVLVPDLPTCGYSEKPKRQRYTVGYFASALVGFLDALGIDRAYVAGGSLGGNLTLRLGLEYPERFPRLAAWAPAGWIGTNAPAAIGARISRGLGPWAFWAVYHFQKQTWYSDAWPGKRDSLVQADLFRDEVYSETYHDSYFDIAAEQTESSWLSRASEIEQPTLVLCGKNDHALGMFETVSQQLVPSLPNATFQDDFHFGRHSLASEDPAQLARYVLQFFPPMT